MSMKLEISDYIEKEDGGAVVVLEMDEKTREALISEALQRRIMEGLKHLGVELTPETNYDSQIDIEDYINVETRQRLDTVEPT